MLKIRSAGLATIVLLAFAAASCASAQTRETEPGGEITSLVESIIEKHKLPGAAVFIRKDGQTLYQKSFGAYELDTVVPLASATKWVTAATVATVIDEEGLSLDETLSAYIPGLEPDKAAITLRQLLSHTSGFPGDHALAEPTDQPLEDAARKLAAMRLAAAPGEELIYGGVSLQIAGYVAQSRAGKDWQLLFRERIATPLGWTEAVWDHPLRPPTVDNPGNPNLGAGLRISASDYIAFLEMLDGKGVYRGKRILSASVVQAILRDQAGDALKSRLPPTVSPDWSYGLGCWCEIMNDAGECLLANSGGAFGTLPWIDQRTGVYGVIVLETRMPLVFDDLMTFRELANALAE
jgi:CubicO group peptidase (beta-lactamase class C family)